MNQEQLNHLEYRATNGNDLSFELLVDGELIERLESGDVAAIPYWLFENGDLPSYFNHFRKREEHLLGYAVVGNRVVGVPGA